MDLRGLIKDIFEYNREGFCDHFIGELDSSAFQTKRDVYDFVFGIATHYQRAIAFSNLFEHDNETTIEYVIDCLVKEIVKES